MIVLMTHKCNYASAYMLDVFECKSFKITADKHVVWNGNAQCNSARS